MGMFTNDLLFGGERLDKQEWITIGESARESTQVLLLDAVIVSDEVPTELGNASKTNLLIAPLLEGGTVAGEPVTLGTLAAPIAEKARQKTPGDLPAVVCFMTVASKFDNDATVMQFVRRWDGKLPKFEPLPDGLPF